MPAESALLDVWRRHYCRLGYHPEKPDQAALFLVSVRLPADATNKALAVSGVKGVYLKPRTADGLRPDEQWSVIWLPRIDKAAAVLQKQTVQGAASMHGANGHAVRHPGSYSGSSSRA